MPRTHCCLYLNFTEIHERHGGAEYDNLYLLFPTMLAYVCWHPEVLSKCRKLKQGDCKGGDCYSSKGSPFLCPWYLLEAEQDACPV